MHADITINHLAGDLLQARGSAQLTELPSQSKSIFDLEQGYQVGHLLHTHMVGRGAVAVGRKIGFTNPATWQEFNLDTPIWAHMYSESVHFANQDRYRLSLADMTAPRIEPEVVVKLKHPLSECDLSAEAIVTCLDWVAIGFEIVDSHFPDWRFTAADAVADFGVHAALVVGTPWRVSPDNAQDVIASLQELVVSLHHGNEIVAQGKGSNALGSPLLALGHLARVIEAQPWAPPLEPGEIITTGTLTPLPFVHSGEEWRVEISGAPLAPLTLELNG